MIDGNYTKKSITWFEATWIYFYAEIVQHWTSEKTNFSSKKCLLRFSVKKQIWCHVLEIDDDATNRLYMHVLSLSIWVCRTRSIFQCHQRIVFIPIHIGAAFFQSLEYTLTHTYKRIHSLSNPAQQTLANTRGSTRVLRFPVYRKLSLHFQCLVTCSRAKTVGRFYTLDV